MHPGDNGPVSEKNKDRKERTLSCVVNGYVDVVVGVNESYREG